LSEFLARLGLLHTQTPSLQWRDQLPLRYIPAVHTIVPPDGDTPKLDRVLPGAMCDTKSGLTTPFIERIISLDAIAFPSGEMVKKANIQPHLTSTELKTRYLCSTDRVESRRWHLLW